MIFNMAYESNMARMTLNDPEVDDTFPERHVLDHPSEFKPQLETQDEHAHADFPARHLRRRRRRRSESIEGYEMRDRYWEAMDIIEQDLTEATKAPAVWDYVYDPVCLPPSGFAKTPGIRLLGRHPIRRAWRRLNSREHPDLGSTRIVEGIMLYERGMILSRQFQCTHCQKRQGISPECIVMDPDEEAKEPLESLGGLRSICSNCLYDGRQCDAQISSRRNQPSRTPTPSQIKRSFASNLVHLEVLDLVDKKLKSIKGDGKEDALSRAKQIEMAALEIAQEAHEWGLGIKEKRRKTLTAMKSTN
ncbi:hypothetical protein F4813DRAFT_194221 [Daldinia decipiens]|uniref:uncharacterized protein n=1 Tax=Daldinia decipiens TaxID=326647 RepID=UPI0020C3494B|nr:uncharacterized protein F4813DRAFT_194221 [Daldinia decipiens]KAI1654996.1 hypothetical protein F4813DRAFT_194221 [Daldinia decipiens]